MFGQHHRPESKGSKRLRVHCAPRAAAVAATSALVLVAAACSSGGSPTPQPNVTDASTNVAFTACTPEACAGELDGSPFQIAMPQTWNGTLLIYSQDVQPPDPGIKIRQSVADLAPGWSEDNRAVADALLAQGYGLAGAATPADGWQVESQVAIGQKLRDHFVAKVGTPNRVYTWGEGSGALASVVLAQQQEWVSGAAPLCGILAGLNPNYDLALDAAYLVKTLIYPEMKLTGYESQAEAANVYKSAMARVKKAAADVYDSGGMQLAMIAAAGEIPTKSATNSGSGLRGKATTVPEALSVILARGTLGRFAIEQQFGGNPSTNVGTDYDARITASERAALAVFDKKAVDRYLKTINKGKRVSADPSAREAAAKSGAITGDVRVPTATLHTEYDTQAIVQNESAYWTLANQAGPDSLRLLHVNVTSPPTSYPEEGAVPYGAGHCNFTPQSVVGTVAIVNDMVRDGIFPTVVNTTRLLGPNSGLNASYKLQRWPPGPTA